MDYATGDLTVLDLNTHVATSIRNGTLSELVRRHDPDVLLLQEVRAGKARRLLARTLGDGWRLYGKADSIVAVRDSPRWHIIGAVSPANSHGEHHERHATCVSILDHTSGRVIYLQSIHCQPLAKGIGKAALGAVRRQAEQLSTFVERSAVRPPEAVVIDGGDFNQRMDQPPERLPARRRKYSAHVRWAEAGLYSAARLTHGTDARLDACMVRDDPHVRITAYRVLATHRPGDDHPALLLRLRIGPREVAAA